MAQNKSSNDLIFRKQSLWLIMAALVNAGVFIFDLYRIDGVPPLRVVDNFPSLLIAIVIVALPILSMFMFRDRKKQLRITAWCMFSSISFISLTLTRVTRMEKAVPEPSNGTYWIGAILPIVAMIFIIMAMVAIRKDDKLVRSMDRLR